MDLWEPYAGELLPGMYFVKTDNQLPARGGGFYTDGFLKYLEKEGIPFNVKYQCLASETYPSNYSDTIFENVIQYPKFKLMSNGLIRSFWSTMSTSTKVYLEESFETAMVHYFNGMKMKKAQFHINPLNERKSLH